jgi:hypothetical protein
LGAGATDLTTGLISKLFSGVTFIALAELLIGASNPTNERIPIQAFLSLLIKLTS